MEALASALEGGLFVNDDLVDVAGSGDHDTLGVGQTADVETWHQAEGEVDDFEVLARFDPLDAGRGDDQRLGLGVVGVEPA
ncbi:hypothetical protein scyTo_0026359 [Scyliorhinus torazame]|uniref:Uncharacterized protein n=1 Tax=Scyliorhinus torazame TaxID=75743 RepID=A0A401QJX8_SCYTO|nr:hypothetical protein [Scyliorhinus torazame]